MSLAQKNNRLYSIKVLIDGNNNECFFSVRSAFLVNFFQSFVLIFGTTEGVNNYSQNTEQNINTKNTFV